MCKRQAHILPAVFVTIRQLARQIAKIGDNESVALGLHFVSFRLSDEKTCHSHDLGRAGSGRRDNGAIVITRMFASGDGSYPSP